MKSLFYAAFTALMLSGCSGIIDNFDNKPELTSPCVGAEDSPCGPKRPVNSWLYS